MTTKAKFSYRQKCFKALHTKLLHQIGRAIEDYNLIEDNDSILVALSGGKDSWSMFYLLEELRKKAPIKFSLKIVTVNPGFEGFQTNIIEKHLKSAGFDCLIKKTSMIDILQEKINPGTSFCSFCARLRRGVLYNLAPTLNCNKIALAHHSDDAIETLLLNQFYSGKIKSMPPKLISDDGRNIVIRPMIYTKEEDIKRYAKANKFPIICCNCPISNSDDHKRKFVKKLLIQLEETNPHLKGNLLNSLKNIAPSHLLDKNLSSK